MAGSIEKTGIVIVGGGIAGASLAWFLAQAGRGDVIVLEREASLAVHSTGRSAATLSELDGDPTLCAIKVAASAFFRSPPPGFSDSPLLRPTGVVSLVSERELPGLPARERFLRSLGLDFRILTPAETVAQVPELRASEFAAAIDVACDGRLDVHEILSSYLRGARSHGAEIRLGTAVRDVIVEGGRCVGVATDRGEIRADLVVDAAGAWAGRVAAMADASPIPLQPLRRSIFLFPTPPGVDPAAWPEVISDAHSVYFAPEVGEMMASPMDEVPMEPCDPSPDEETIAAAVERLARLAPRLRPATIRHRWSGLRTFSPDRVHVVGEDPRRPGFFWLAAQGGCGIETSSLIGRVAADLVVRGSTDAFEARRLAPGRFDARVAAGDTEPFARAG
ncbi:MAG: NAD(P)/FAD-dependent oxidoreductase [Alphaproteobacteria bacterium]